MKDKKMAKRFGRVKEKYYLCTHKLRNIAEWSSW